MSSYFSKIFGASPVKPLQAHMEKAAECAARLPAFFDAAFSGDWEAATVIRADISRNEHEADALKKDLRLHMPKNLLMPVARADLLSVLLVQDEVANLSKDIAGIVIGSQDKLPRGTQEILPGNAEAFRRCGGPGQQNSERAR